MSLKENIEKKLAAQRAARAPNHSNVSYMRRGSSLHIITADRRLWVVPWAHLYGADYQAQTDNERIHIVTRLHDVSIEGNNLEGLTVRIGRHEVESIQAGTPSDFSHPKPWTPFIRKITVIEKSRAFSDN